MGLLGCQNLNSLNQRQKAHASAVGYNSARIAAHGDEQCRLSFMLVKGPVLEDETACLRPAVSVYMSSACSAA